MNTTENGLDFYENLIIQYLSETIARNELLILNEWLELRPENKHFFEQTREIWLSSKVASNPKGFDAAKGYQQFLTYVRKTTEIDKNNRGKKLFFSLSRVAAMVLLAFGLGILADNVLGLFHAKSELISQQEITVPLGSKSKIKLPDGTSVTLNAGSRLTYKTNFGKTNREVWLEGEGYFSVAKDKKRTFIVKTGYLDIKALGTEFNVKAYPNEKSIQTTLVEGSVKIEKNFKGSSDQSKDNSVILKPKERYTFLIDSEKDVFTKVEDEVAKTGKEHQKEEKMTPKVSVIYKNIDPIPDISWKERRWVISEEKLGDLAIKLERRYDVNINFADENLKVFRFTGTLQDESIEQVLKVISLSSPIVFDIDGKQVNFHNNEEFAKKYKGLYKSNKH
jgi:ferric-dicitrate binding protein FerR (iron transport regulator)